MWPFSRRGGFKGGTETWFDSLEVDKKNNKRPNFTSSDVLDGFQLESTRWQTVLNVLVGFCCFCKRTRKSVSVRRLVYRLPSWPVDITRLEPPSRQEREIKTQHWSLGITHLHHRLVKIYRAKNHKKQKIENECKRSRLPSSHKSLLENVQQIHTFFFWHKNLFAFLFDTPPSDTTVVLFGATRSSRLCANIQCISIQ